MIQPAAESSVGQAELEPLFEAIRAFAADFSASNHAQLRGVTDGKAVGTYIEHKFRDFLLAQQIISVADFGSSAKGIDLPSLDADIKVTPFASLNLPRLLHHSSKRSKA